MYTDELDNLEKNIADNITRLFKETKKKKIDLAKALGVVHTNISRYCDGTYIPSFKALLIMADFFGVSISEITGIKSLSPNISDEEYNLLMKYKEQTPEVQNAIKKILDIK